MTFQSKVLFNVCSSASKIISETHSDVKLSRLTNSQKPSRTQFNVLHSLKMKRLHFRNYSQ